MVVTVRKKWWLALAAAWPITYLFLLLFPLRWLASLGYPIPAPGPRDRVWTATVLTLHGGTIVLAWAILMFCLVYLLRGVQLGALQKAMWCVLLIAAPIITTPVFVWLHVQTADGDGGVRARRAAEQRDEADER